MLLLAQMVHDVTTDAAVAVAAAAAGGGADGHTACAGADAAGVQTR